MANRLLERLSRQLAAKGNKNSKQMSASILNKQGSMKGSKLTPHGEKRQALGNGGRAKDRAAKATKANDKPSDFTYNAKTNRAKKK